MPATAFSVSGDRLSRALALHDQGMSQRSIASVLHVATATLQNALSAALCVRSGHVPAERKPSGRLSEAGRSRLREALRKGMRGTEIQLLLGVAAGTVSKERTRYNADLKRRRKKPLPPVGGGERYGGARLSSDTLKEIERLLLDGWSSRAIAERLGISKTPCLTVRAKLIRRAARRGRQLAEIVAATRPPAKPHAARGKSRAVIPPAARAGSILPQEHVTARPQSGVEQVSNNTPVAVGPKPPMTFEEQLAAVAAGRGLVAAFKPRRADPDYTLGGVATGAL